MKTLTALICLIGVAVGVLIFCWAVNLTIRDRRLKLSSEDRIEQNEAVAILLAVENAYLTGIQNHQRLMLGLETNSTSRDVLINYIAQVLHLGPYARKE